jgi:hypothetical protein
MLRSLSFLVALLALPGSAHAFCGFYVGKAGAELYNEASQVVLVRDGPRTVLTMSNDFKGNMKDFALVVPVPSVLEKEQIHIGDRKLIEPTRARCATPPPWPGPPRMRGWRRRRPPWTRSSPPPWG